MMKITHSDSKKQAIVEAAIRLFSQNGLDGTSIKDIAREVGVSDAALYKHFPSKMALAAEIFVHYLVQYTNLIDYHRTKDCPFPEKLHGLVDDIVDRLQNERFGLLLLGQQHELFNEITCTRRVPLQAAAELVQSGVQTGAIPMQDALLSASMLIGSMLRLAVFTDNGIFPEDMTASRDEIHARIRGLLGLK